jgi:hypothetical protein
LLEVTEETEFTNGGTGSTETKRREPDGWMPAVRREQLLKQLTIRASPFRLR